MFCYIFPNQRHFLFEVFPFSFLLANSDISMGLSASLSYFQITEGIYCLTWKDFSLKNMSCSALSGNSSVPWVCMHARNAWVKFSTVFWVLVIYTGPFSLCAVKPKYRTLNAPWWEVLVNKLHLVCIFCHKLSRKYQEMMINLFLYQVLCHLYVLFHH